MTKKIWTLTDVDADLYVEHLSLGPDQVGGPASGYGITKRRLRGGLRDGVDVVEVHNGLLQFVAVPTRGMGIWRARCGDVPLGWNSPVKGPVHPAFVHTWEGTGIGFLDGFDELLCRCGLESNGAPEFLANGALRYPLHGKIANLPAHKVEVILDGDSGEIAVRGTVDESRLFGNKLRMVTTLSTRVGEPSVTITDEITNLSGVPGELELLYHCNFGIPLVDQGASLRLPIRRLAPRDAAAAADMPNWNRYGAPGSAMELCFFADLQADANGETQVLLRSAAGDRGVSLAFNKRQLPCFTLWKNPQAPADGYVTGLEPGINYPNRKSFEKERGRVAELAPGESRQFQVTISAHTDSASLAAAEQAIAAIQKTAAPEILSRPHPDWSPQ